MSVGKSRPRIGPAVTGGEARAVRLAWTVADQLMKKEVILLGMGWGHMPSFLISQELRDERLLSISGRHFPGGTATIVAARRRDVPHGPTAKRLWQFIAEQVPAVSQGVHVDEPKSFRHRRTAAPAGRGSPRSRGFARGSKRP